MLTFQKVEKPQEKFIEKKKDTDILKLIDEYDANMLSYIARLYESMSGEKLDFTKIKSAVDALQQYNNKQEYCYLNNLLHPETAKGVKIPSPIPVPSCSFQLHNSITLSTNASGNLALVFNPFFLASTNAIREYTTDAAIVNITGLSSLWVNNSASLTGSESNASFMPVNIGQVIPPVYDQYRLVSASLVIKYIGRLDIASGVIGGAIVFDEDAHVGATATAQRFTSPNLAKYGNFDLAMDSFYHQENLCLEGLRELYFPIDNSFEEYVRTVDGSHLQIVPGESYELVSDQDYYKSGFNWMVYVLGAPPSSACFKLDIYCNYECLPNASFLNYLPLSMNVEHISNEEKKQANLIVQNKPIMKLSENKVTKTPNIFQKMIKKFGNALPSIGKLLAEGIVKSIPSLKPGIAIANAMLAANASPSLPQQSNNDQMNLDEVE